MREYYVYFLTNEYNTVLYIGLTGNLNQRIQSHKDGKGGEFSKKYKLTKLVWAELFVNAYDAITSEKRFKNWHKDWKWDYIRQRNPRLEDLAGGDAESSSA